MTSRSAGSGVLRRGLAAALVALALAGCTIAPAPPLMSPIAVTRSYGFGEQPTGPGRWDVTYVGPARRSLRSPDAWAANAAAERTQAYDFALWRAAQIAIQQGYAGFRAGNVRTNLASYPDDLDGPWGPPGFGPWPYRGWGYPPYYGGYWGPSPYAYMQTSVSIDVELLRATGPGDYVAADAIEQLRRTYPGAEGPPPAPPQQQPQGAPQPGAAPSG